MKTVYEQLFEYNNDRLIVVLCIMSRAKGSGVTRELKIASKRKRASRSCRRCIYKCLCFTGECELNQTQTQQNSTVYCILYTRYSDSQRAVQVQYEKNESISKEKCVHRREENTVRCERHERRVGGIRWMPIADAVDQNEL